MFVFNELDLEDMGYGNDRRYKNLNWVKTWLSQQEYINQARYGYWQITKEGIEYLNKLK